MKKFLITCFSIILLLSLTSCSDAQKAATTTASNLKAAQSANDAESVAEAEEMLSVVYSDFIDYYRILYKKATAATDDAFKNYDTSGIKVRDRSKDEIRIYFLSGWDISTADDGNDRDEKLYDLCKNVNTFYENVYDLKDSSYRNNVLNLCNRLYDYLESLADYLGKTLPSDILRQPVVNTSVAPTVTSTVKTTATTKTTASTTATVKATTATSTVIGNSRWDGKNASGASNGYSIVFYNGKAYLGTTLESTSDIISGGQACTYQINDGKIYFKAVGDSRTATMSYTSTKLTESSKKSETMFEVNYVLYKN